MDRLKPGDLVRYTGKNREGGTVTSALIGTLGEVVTIDHPHNVYVHFFFPRTDQCRNNEGLYGVLPENLEKVRDVQR